MDTRLTKKRNFSNKFKAAAKLRDAVLCLHLGKGFRHTVEPEYFELIQSWMIKHTLSFSMEVTRLTDIGVSDRGLVRGPGARFAIQTILENGMQG